MKYITDVFRTKLWYKWKALYIILILMLLILIYAYILSRYLPNYIPTLILDEKPRAERDKKVILAWTRMFGSSTFYKTSACPEIKDLCKFTEDRSYVKVADAVVFHSRDAVDKPHPMFRNQNQTYIFWTLEAPHNARGRIFPEFFFNWTMTFSPKSEVRYSYGEVKFVEKNSNATSIGAVPLFPDELFATKKKAIFGLISNCGGERMRIVERISRVFPVHLAGSCGWDKQWKELCPKSSKNCTPIIKETINDHMFHFVLENSDCVGYVTEKTYSRLRYNSIPIASRRHVYQVLDFPPNAFIFLDDFRNEFELSERLRYLSTNRSAYLEYFAWRTKYGIQSTVQDEAWCGLCKKLLNRNEERKMMRDPFVAYTKCYGNSSVWNMSFREQLPEYNPVIIMVISIIVVSIFLATCKKNKKTQVKESKQYCLDEEPLLGGE